MIILNLRLDLALVLGGTLPGKVGQRTVAGSLELHKGVSIVVGPRSLEAIAGRTLR